MATERICFRCGDPLLGKKKKWCSAKCQKLEGRRKHIETCFGLTLEDYDAILREQDGKCAICRKPPKPGKSLAVDHAHREGRSGPVRGLLCFFCNKRLIGARADEAILRMAEYVTDPPATRALGREVIAPGRPPKKRKSRKGSGRKRG